MNQPSSRLPPGAAFEEDTLRSLPAALFARAALAPEAVCMRRKRLGLWEELSWRDYELAVRAVAMALVEAGVKPGEPVGLISENRVEWLWTDLGILAAGAVTCAMYTTSSVEQVAYIVQHSGARVVFVEDEEQLDKLLEVRALLEHGGDPEAGNDSAPDAPSTIRRIVVFDDEGLRSFSDPAVLMFDQLLARGRELLDERGAEVDERGAALTPDDLAILVYTSGTTGPPKGVMLSHANILWTCRALRALSPPRPDDEYLSFLPLCHIAERTITVFNQVVNGSIVSFAENLDTVRSDMAEVRPHVFFAVPRIWEKLYNAIELRMQDASWAKRRAYRWAMAIGRRYNQWRQRGDRDPPVALGLAQRLAELSVLRPLRRKLGLDRTRYAISGAAPISADVIAYFQALGVPLVEGYGQTESTAIITLHPPGFVAPGTVGTPIDGVELTIADDGEILARSPGVMLGYYRHEEASAETVDGEGWLHTGDVGELDERGRLRITDRKKDLIITAGGKNIAPQYIESKLRLSPYVHDAIVVGERRKFVTALIVLDEDNLVAWAQDNRVQFGAYADLAKSAEVHKLVSVEIRKTNETLTHVEAVKRFSILERRLDRDEGELTPTLKVRRKVIEDKYGDLIEAMYRSSP